MVVELLSVCRRPPAWVAAATADYARRLAPAIALRFRQIAPGPDSATSAVRRRDEARRLRAALGRASHVVALDEGGEELTSPGLASWLAAWRERTPHVTLIVGGADGLDASIQDSAAQRWSLSRLTLPHLLVQIVVAEQLYRAWTIIEHHPYHRA
jgi:23S rRNA (pseudouridine1915-N3)-methyltransferase